MTITDIGILLIVLCVLLWAVMAALHRHTVQLNAIRKQLEKITEESGVAHEGSTPPEDELAPRRPDRPLGVLSGTSRKS